MIPNTELLKYHWGYSSYRINEYYSCAGFTMVEDAENETGDYWIIYDSIEDLLRDAIIIAQKYITTLLVNGSDLKDIKYAEKIEVNPKVDIEDIPEVFACEDYFQDTIDGKEVHILYNPGMLIVHFDYLLEKHYYGQSEN
jgi:hypothetical protein